MNNPSKESFPKKILGITRGLAHGFHSLLGIVFQIDKALERKEISQKMSDRLYVAVVKMLGFK